MLSKGNWIAVAALVVLIAVPLMAASSGSLNLSLKSPIYVAGNQIGAGPLRINWEDVSADDPAVTFASNGRVVIKTHAKIVDLDTPSTYSSIITTKDAEGREVLKEVRLGGKKTALVFE